MDFQPGHSCQCADRGVCPCVRPLAIHSEQMCGQMKGADGQLRLESLQPVGPSRPHNHRTGWSDRRNTLSKAIFLVWETIKYSRFSVGREFFWGGQTLRKVWSLFIGSSRSTPDWVYDLVWNPVTLKGQSLYPSRVEKLKAGTNLVIINSDNIHNYSFVFWLIHFDGETQIPHLNLRSK